MVLDLETQHSPYLIPNGWQKTHRLGLACAVLYEERTHRFLIYGPKDAQALRKRLLAADQITTYGGWHFDFPVLWRVPRDAWPLHPRRRSTPSPLQRPPTPYLASPFPGPRWIYEPT